MSDIVGKGIMLMFGLMVIGVMTYLFFSGEFVTLQFNVELASQMGITPHQLGLYFAILIMFVIPVILIPLVVVLIVWTR